jgi:hypothetical protein
MRDKLSKDKIDRLDKLEIQWISKKKAEWQRNYITLCKYPMDTIDSYRITIEIQARLWKYLCGPSDTPGRMDKHAETVYLIYFSAR